MKNLSSYVGALLFLALTIVITTVATVSMVLDTGRLHYAFIGKSVGIIFVVGIALLFVTAFSKSVAHSSSGKLPDNIPRAIGLNFGDALEALKRGCRICRVGWNGKGMWLYHVPAGIYKAVTESARAAFGDDVPYGDYIAMKTAQNNVVPWLASQTDVLAQDWQILS